MLTSIPTFIGVPAVGIWVCDCAHCVEPLPMKRQPMRTTSATEAGDLFNGSKRRRWLIRNMGPQTPYLDEATTARRDLATRNPFLSRNFRFEATHRGASTAEGS